MDNTDNQELEKFDQRKKEYLKSPKGKLSVKKYQRSDKGKNAYKKYHQTPAFKLALRKYYYSEKGQETYKRKRVRDKLFNDIDKWLEDNPKKTIDNYFDHLKENDTP